jgi:lipoprotein-releasing system ATP-binding protein
MSDPVIRAREIHKAYVRGPRRVEVLRGLDLDVAAGEAVAVVGDSGVGKSTLMHVLGGLDRPDRGEVRFRGAAVYDRSGEELARYRNREVGFVFQFHHLLPEFDALDNVLMPFRVGRRRPDRPRARAILARLGLEHRAEHTPGELSGGEQQRVAVARAVAPGPTVVLADEPTGNLDPGTGERVFRLLRELQEEEGFALVLATHSARLARGCDRVLRLTDGALRPLGEREARDYFGLSG